MQLNWDYTSLAESYVYRPDYSTTAIDQMCQIMNLGTSSVVCDVGAGVGHLTLELKKRGMVVTAVEPNDAMYKGGKLRTQHLDNVMWCKGTGEQTNQKSNHFDAVTFGSSFNVCQHDKALQESLRICKSGGWFACMWNHRDLQDPIQKNIEKIIFAHIPQYNYGSRRQDQMPILQASGLFESLEFIEGATHHQQTVDECVEAWRSHATLHKQTKGNDQLFHRVVAQIEQFLRSLNSSTVDIPYTTRIWIGKFFEKK